VLNSFDFVVILLPLVLFIPNASTVQFDGPASFVFWILRFLVSERVRTQVRGAASPWKAGFRERQVTRTRRFSAVSVPLQRRLS